jgi:hypothetical protein
MKKGIQLFKDPLVHFLLAGLILFLIFNVVSPNKGDLDPKTVIVDREAILIHVQNTSKMFDPKIAAAKFDGMNEREKEALINDYIREEVMFREASSLGLDKEDYVMRRRVIQKLDFITDDIIEQSVKIDDDALNKYFNENKDSYYVEPFIILTHIFFDAEKHSKDELVKLAADKKDELNKKQVIFSDSVQHGDRFLYHVNYVERTYDFIQSHFGDEMAGKVFSLTPSNKDWYGPFQSQYGYHLVMISKKQEGRYSTFEDVKRQVEMDFHREEKRKRKEETIAKIIEGYDVQIKLQ